MFGPAQELRVVRNVVYWAEPFVEKLVHEGPRVYKPDSLFPLFLFFFFFLSAGAFFLYSVFFIKIKTYKQYNMMHLAIYFS